MPLCVSAQASIIITLLAIVNARWPQAGFDPTPAAAQDARHTFAPTTPANQPSKISISNTTRWMPSCNSGGLAHDVDGSKHGIPDAFLAGTLADLVRSGPRLSAGHSPEPAA
jgi:hypothetical protein